MTRHLLITCAIILPLRAEGEIHYGRDIRPILSDKCFFCHGTDPKTREEDLRLDLREAAVAAKAIIPGKPEASLLIKRINATAANQVMPPPKSHKSLTPAEKQLLSDWIKGGAIYQPHWAYTPPRREPNQTPDTLVARELGKRNLCFSPPAEPAVLLRRLHFDVIGLPPTPAETAAFQQAYAQDPQAAVRQVVDQLLASPHFGERMAVAWLDAVRYADTVGYHGDKERSASPFRDYVIDAFNRDLPFDQFTIEQIAGDLLPAATISQQVAASYNRLNQLSEEGGIQDAEYLAKYQAERVRTTSSTWLGSTMACCECHDHKFDPFTAKDFYSFAAFFSDILEKGAWNNDGKFQENPDKWLKQGVKFDEWGPLLQVPTAEQTARLAVIDARLAELRSQPAPNPPAPADAPPAGAAPTPPADNPPAPPANPAPNDELARLEAERAALLKAAPTVPATISAKPREIRLLNRGDWQDTSGPVVSPATPAFLTSATTPAPAAGAARPSRLDLARWIASKDNPLTARVFVNRLWARLFGVGLSKDIGDLGSQGEYPSHPELLDWLAVEFMENHWSVKHLMRTILLSQVYQQSSTPTGTLTELDPKNRLLARQSQLRLPAELIRDNALAVSGLLTPTIGGPSAKPYQPDGYYRHLNFPIRTYQADKGPLLYRRGLYTHWQRTFLHPMLKAFDAPSREECCPDRSGSNTPLQALNLLNDPSFTEAARALATRLLTEPAGESDLVPRAFLRCLSRPPTPAEAEILNQFHAAELARFTANPAAAAEFLAIGELPVAKDLPPARLAAATAVARAILNLHETITRY
jgi:hypothetical protein